MIDAEAPEGASEPAYYNHSERLKLDRWLHETRFAGERDDRAVGARIKALDLALVYHRDVAKPDYWDKAEKSPPATPDEILATAASFAAFLSNPPENGNTPEAGR